MHLANETLPASDPSHSRDASARFEKRAPVCVCVAELAVFWGTAHRTVFVALCAPGPAGLDFTSLR